MFNPYNWIVSWIKDAVWLYQFNHTSIERLGNLPVKYFRGAYYVVNEDGTR